MGLKLDRFELLSKLQSENMKFFSDASYEVQSTDFKINTAHLAKVVSVMFQYLKPEIEDYIKEKEGEMSVEVNSSSECLGVPGTGDEGASNVSASSQDVSISAQPGRDSPIAIPMTAATSIAVQDDTLHLPITPASSTRTCLSTTS